MKNNPGYWKKLYQFLFAVTAAFCTACTFFMNYESCGDITLETNNKIYYHVYRVLEEMKFACNSSEFTLSLSMAGFLVLYIWFCAREQYHVKIRMKIFLSMVFSFVHVTGTMILNDFSWRSSGQLVKMGIAFAGGCFFYNVAIQLLYVFLRKDHEISFAWIPKRFRTIFMKRPGLSAFCIFLCCWSIPSILKYPAGICVDVARQLDQGLGYIPLTAHHPVFHTMLMTWFVEFGRGVGSANLGIFLFCLVETVVLAAVFGFIISVLVKFSAGKWVLAVSVFFFSFSPYITGYVGTPIKDLYFVAMVCVYVTVLFVYSMDRHIFWSERRYPVLLILSSVGMVLFRNNGIYICLLTGIVVLINEIRLCKRKAAFHVAILLLAMVMAFSSTKIINYIYQPVPGSIREALSIPFQQTARYAVQYGDEVTEEEKEVINKILPYDRLAELYKPHISDPVKNRYNDEATKEELKEYLKVWFQQFTKHPGCYVKSVYEQNIYLLYPQYNNYTYYLDTSPFARIDASMREINTPEILEKIQVVYKQALELSHKLPILSLVNNMAVYIMLLLIFCTYLLTEKRYSHLFYYLPLLISLLIIIAAPCIRGHVRYAYPVIYTFPVWLAGMVRKK